MASITVTLTGICAGGNHVTLSITGDRTATLRGDVDQLKDALTEEDVLGFAKVVTRMARQGKTLAQWRTAMQAGVTVTV